MRPIILITIFLLSSCVQSIVNREIDKKLDEYQRTAFTCLEVEGTTQKIVRMFFQAPAPKPHWSDLKYAKDQSDRVSEAARDFSHDDKVQHCYVGHYLAQQRNFKTGVFAAFFKEAMDVGDCRRGTHFEISDKLATIIGSRMASRAEDVASCYEVRAKLDRQMENFLMNRYEADRAYLEAMLRVCSDRQLRRTRPNLHRQCHSLGL